MMTMENLVPLTVQNFLGGLFIKSARIISIILCVLLYCKTEFKDREIEDRKRKQ